MSIGPALRRANRLAMRLWWGGSPPPTDERIIRSHARTSRTGLPLITACMGAVLLYHVLVGSPAWHWLDFAAILLISWLIYCSTLIAGYGSASQAVLPVAVSAAFAACAGVAYGYLQPSSAVLAGGVALLAWPPALFLIGQLAGWSSARLQEDEAWQLAQGLGMYRGLMALSIMTMLWPILRMLIDPQILTWVPFWFAFVLPAALTGTLAELNGKFEREDAGPASLRAKWWPGFLAVTALVVLTSWRRGDLTTVPSGIMTLSVIVLMEERRRRQRR